MSGITAIYLDGVFRPVDPVELPDNCEVELQFQVRMNSIPTMQPADDARSSCIEDKLAALAARVPNEDWERLPADLSDQLDHYVYGTPRE